MPEGMALVQEPISGPPPSSTARAVWTSPTPVRIATRHSTAASCSSGRSAAGRATARREQIDHPGEFADNPDVSDLLPKRNFRAPLSSSLAFNATTGSLEYVYQNNTNRLVSGADISFQQSRDLGTTWSHAKFISITRAGLPRTTSSCPGLPRMKAETTLRLAVPGLSLRPWAAAQTDS
jgi:hypothetical protein